MKNFIERLRQKPPHKKKAITFFTSLGLTLFIFVLWAISFMVSLDNVALDNSKNEDVATPIEALGGQVNSLLGRGDQ